MIKKQLEEAINEQINAEIFSSNLYYSMSAYFESLSLKGISKWLRIQALEEMTHVQRFFDYLNDRGGRVVMKAVDAPQVEWDSPLAAFEHVLEHEQQVTELINNLMDLALKESDHASVNFLQWFIGEQVEEEASADEVVQKLKLVEKTEGGLFLLDQELEKRVFVLPPDLANAF